MPLLLLPSFLADGRCERGRPFKCGMVAWRCAWVLVSQALVEAGYSPTYGARPLRRAVQRLCEDAVAEAVLSGFVNDGEVRSAHAVLERVWSRVRACVRACVRTCVLMIGCSSMCARESMPPSPPVAGAGAGA